MRRRPAPTSTPRDGCKRGFAATQPHGEAREDWTILRAFSAVLGQPLPYDTTAAVRERMVAVNPVFATVQVLPMRGCTDAAGPATGALDGAGFAAAVEDYYQTNPIARASPTMAECSRTYTHPPMQQAAE